MAIRCCYGCVAPKRYPGCHDRCPNYAKEKAIHNEQKALEDKQKSIDGGITAQKAKGIYRANRSKRPMQTGWKRRR